MSLALRDYQVQAIAAIKAREEPGARVPLVLATGLGKGHPLDTDVPTPDGWRTWGDLEVGDRVFGRRGDPTIVTAIYDRGALPTYLVTFSDESSVEVDGDHIWAVRDSGRSYRPWITTTTAELARHELKRPVGWRFHIPITGQVLYDEHPALPLDPYVVGALVSNGGMTTTGTQLTTPDLEVAERVARTNVINLINDATEGTCPRYSLPGLTDVTAQLGLRVKSADKRIPPAYLTAGARHRIALLHGLMDGDGSKRDASRRSVSYFTSSLGLAEDVRELVNSLGGTGIVKRYDRDAKGVEYAVRILLPSAVEAFGTMRKSGNGVTSVRNLQPKRAIVSIEPVGTKPIRCITVSAPDHLYLIGRGYHVTHNTVIFTSYVTDWLDRNAGQRALIIVHTDELAEQALAKMRQVAPHRRAGMVKAGRNDVHAEIIVSSRQTLGSARRREQIKRVGLIVIDECHHAVRSNGYGKILEHFGVFDDAAPAPSDLAYLAKLESGEEPEHYPGMLEDVRRAALEAAPGGAARPFVLGVTATLARGDKAKLSTVWSEPAFTRDILYGIRHGYLLDVRGERVIVPDLDLSRVRVRAGEYNENDIADELERTFAPEVIAQKYVELAGGRRGIAFWPLVDTAYHGEKAFLAAGIRSGTVHGSLPKPERRELLQRFRLPLEHSEAIDVMHNAMVLCEGFDEPTADVVVIARPSKNAALIQQMVGRVLRPDLTKPPAERGQALILDVTGAGAHSNAMRALIDLSPERAARADEDTDLSLSEWDEYLDEVEEELEEQRAGGSYEFDSPAYVGPAATETFDPLGRDKVWGKTPAGHYYINTGAGYVFLAPSLAEGAEPGTVDVVTCSAKAYTVYPSQTKDGTTHEVFVRGTEHTALSLELALGWGEDVAEEMGGHGAKTLTGRKSAWRRAEPTEAQVRLAKSQGIDPTGKTKGELSEELDARFAARRIDPLVAMVQARVDSTSS
jgi:superfamily II DNA or RNA helicase